MVVPDDRNSVLGEDGVHLEDIGANLKSVGKGGEGRLRTESYDE